MKKVEKAKHNNKLTLTDDCCAVKREHEKERDSVGVRERDGWKEYGSE